jgi:hypothetical protein
MTQRAWSRVAGFMFLLYIGTGLTTMVLFRRATGGAEGAAATLASLAGHASTVRLTAVLTLFTFFIAVTLAVALYALTRDEDHDVAMLALCCRVGEGVLAAAGAVRTLSLLSVATASVAASAPDPAAVQALGALLLDQGGLGVPVTATLFAVGSTLYCWLFLRARSIPVWMAWLGLLASLLLVVELPLQLAGLVRGVVTYLVWIPMAVFEVAFGAWLIVRGVAEKATIADR